MKLREHSLATAPASNVLPVPGGPYSNKPDRKRRGQFANSSGYCKHKNHPIINTTQGSTINKTLSREVL
jgi:hypothetical protein